MNLQNVKLFVSPLTQIAYLCNVSGNVIKEKYKLDKDALVDFLVGSVIGLEQELTNNFFIEDENLRIDVKITRKYREANKEEIYILNSLNTGDNKWNSADLN